MTQICDQKINYNVTETGWVQELDHDLPCKSLDQEGCLQYSVLTKETKEKLLVPKGDCYADVAWVPAVTCGIGLVMVLVIERMSTVFGKRVRDAVKDPDTAHIYELSMKNSAEDPDDVMKNVRNMGNSATIAAGFVRALECCPESSHSILTNLVPVLCNIASFAHLYTFAGDL